ncbi:MAG: ABC transporter ATP-binding protein [Lentisphaeria bacterium]|nr:ABC transporter ATP-binding protein [Lentisphaeria bacterium]
MSNHPALEVRGRSKSFAGVAVLEKVSFTLDGPQVVALLGANGVGKSTLMRLIAGFLPADAGTITIDGISMDKNPEEGRKALGYLPENAPSHSGFRVREALSFTAAAYGLRGTALKEAVDTVIAECSLEKVADRICDQLSKGYHRRLGLAQALVHRPRLLMLDEPTDGLDPVQKASARELLKRLGSRHSVLVSTHLLEEVPLICDRVIMIRDRGVKYDGPVPSDLEKRFLSDN